MAIPAAHPSMLISIGVIALVAWRLYARMRRMVGRQTLSRVRPWVTAVVFPVLVVALSLGSLAHPVNALALLAGAGLGVALGVYGLRLTTFEATPQALFYTPNAHLGIALSLLMFGRVAYRMAQLYGVVDPASAAAPTEFFRSPLTLAIFGTLAGYYATYAIGLLRWRRRVGVTPATAASTQL